MAGGMAVRGRDRGGEVERKLRFGIRGVIEEWWEGCPIGSSSSVFSLPASWPPKKSLQPAETPVSLAEKWG